jgi:hypothetical protein
MSLDIFSIRYPLRIDFHDDRHAAAFILCRDDARVFHALAAYR